jgi:hypothetical protein
MLGEMLSGICMAALLPLYCFVTDAFLLFIDAGRDALRHMHGCFTAALLLTDALLMLY